MSALILAIVALAVATYAAVQLGRIARALSVRMRHQYGDDWAGQDVAALRRLWERYEGDGLTVKKPSDKPLSVEVNRD